MRTTKYYEGFQAILDKHDFISKSNLLSVNEVLYMLKEEDVDSNINLITKDNRCLCIPLVKHTFVPAKELALKVKEIECDEEATKLCNMWCLTIYTY